MVEKILVENIDFFFGFWFAFQGIGYLLEDWAAAEL